MFEIGQRVRFHPMQGVDYEGAIAAGPVTVDDEVYWTVEVDGDPARDLIQGREVLFPESSLEPGM